MYGSCGEKNQSMQARDVPLLYLPYGDFMPYCKYGIMQMSISIISFFCYLK